MLHKITTTVFKSAVLAAAALAVGLTVSGHILGLEALLLALGAMLVATIFAFRLAEGPGSDRLSIWAGPVWSFRPAPPPLEAGTELRRAA